MADREYTDDEKRTLRVLKMQEGDLSRLQEQTDSHTQQLRCLTSIWMPGRKKA